MTSEIGRKVYEIEYYERKKVFVKIEIQARRRELKRYIESLMALGHLVTRVEEMPKVRI